MNFVKQVFAALCFCLFLTPIANAQFSPEFNPAPTPCCLPVVMERFAQQLQDWNQLGCHHAEDARLVEGSPS